VFLLIFTLILVAANVAFVRRYVVDKMDAGSMQRAFKAGDRFIAESLSYRFRKPRIGEVVVAKLPGDPKQKILKRVAAGPGAKVSVQGAELVLKADEWYLLGDNVNGSTDSRHFGPIKSGDILGRVWIRY
jgi:signal peptidase I